MLNASLKLTFLVFCLSQTVAALPDSTNAWGYSYDSLLQNLKEWRKSPYIKIDSIGATVEKRAIWMVTITDSGDSLGPIDDASSKKRRIFIHARTHPAEVQAQYIADEAIRFLIDTSGKAEELRRGFIFNIIPMYNPDGVERGFARTNANEVDIESNWNADSLEPEVMVLKRTFETFMASSIPIDVALNLHSDQLNGARFFFFHYAAGTSSTYEDLQRKYISTVQGYFPGGIKNWDFVRSWGTGTKLQYPESFWWLNHREKVLALTFEDTNDPSANSFDSTARALLLGSVDYIRARPFLAIRKTVFASSHFSVLSEGVQVSVPNPGSRWELIDLQGKRLGGGTLQMETTLLTWRDLPWAPIRVLSLYRANLPPERIKLPNRSR